VNQFVEIARPKINLTLRVLGKRSDGYHALASLVAFADGPFDRVTLDCSSPPGVSVSGPFAGLITGANLLQKVLDLVADAAGAATDNCPTLRTGHIRLEKNLPVAAGIGGGSADAAAALRALCRANAELATTMNWQSLAVKLGADVPVCFENRAAWMTGIGEQLTPIPDLPSLDIVLVNPLGTVPPDKTARVFRALPAEHLPTGHVDPLPPGVLTREALISHIDGGNDLVRAASKIMPASWDVLGALRSTPSCRVAAMSGAGPTCLAVYDDARTSTAAAEMIAARHPGWWVSTARIR